MKINSRFNRYDRIFDLLAILFLIVLLVWNIVRLESQPQSPVSDENWGIFVFSDFETLKAGRHFSEEGFADNYFLENMTIGYKEFSRGWYYYQVPLTNPNSSLYYTHSGPMDGVVNAILRSMGITQLTRLYEITALIMVVSMGFWYLLSSFLFGRAIGIISLLFMGTSLTSVNFSHTISGHGYEWFFAFGTVLLFLMAERARSSQAARWLGYGGAWIFTFLQATTTTEFILWLQIFFIGYLWISRGTLRKIWKMVLLMLSAPVASLTIHWIMVARCFGGFENLITDIQAGLARRTTGFALAEETMYRNFDLSQIVPYLNDQLKYRLGMDLIDMAILLALGLGLYFLLRKTALDDMKKRFSAQTRLLFVFLVGGIAFQVIFLQATVTQPQHMFKTIIPFAGLLLGYAAVMLSHYFLSNRKNWFIIIPGLLIFCVIVIPIIKDRDASFNLANDTVATAYLGRTQAEIEILTGFVKQNTLYGDVILTNLDTGQTGHPRYPLAAYEYLADRRFEININDESRVRLAVTEFETIRQGLADTNPAIHIHLYLLMDEQGNQSELGDYARGISDVTYTLETEKWWRENGSEVPAGERNMIFYLYKIIPAKVME